MRIARLLALPLALCPVACHGPDSDARPEAIDGDEAGRGAGAEADAGAGATLAELARRDAAVAALGRADFEAARGIIEDVLVTRYLSTARALIGAPDAEERNPQDGLLWLDRALDIAPKNPEVHLLRGQGNAVLAEQLIARGGNGIYIEGAFEDAIASFDAALLRAPQNVAAMFGASRAAYQLSRFDDALRYAQRGMEAIASGADASRLAPTPERTLAEAAYRAYAEALGSEDGTDRADELFGLTENALGALIGQEARDPWVWKTLANLYLLEDKTADAKSVLKRGLDRVPDDEGLLEWLVNVSRIEGGSSGALLDINAFVNKHPDVARGYWWLGRERFEVAMESLSSDSASETSPSPADFAAAERAFARAREIAPALEAECKGYEVICRNGVGWARYYAGDLEGATESFLSMNEVFPRGVEWRIEDRIPSGIDGLAFVGAAYNDRGDWGAAAAVFDTLRELQPDSADWANNAGFFHRDNAVALEQLGRNLCRRSQDLPTDPVELQRLLDRAGIEGRPDDLAAALRAKAEEYLARAREEIEASYAAYRNSERLAPDDVRAVNDTALVLVHYLFRDLDLAREYLARCIEMGEEQLADETLPDDEREALENAWGDAYQNMGHLYLVGMKQPEEARPYFEKSLGLGDPRPGVTGELLPLCDEDPEHPRLVELRSWGRPCAQNEPREPVR
jgi:hypothetical protein